MRSTPEFNHDEADVALELADEILSGKPTTYRARVAVGDDGPLLGWVCYGPTPMTESTWDLYWIVVSADARGMGVGRALHADAVAAMASEGARRVRIETSTREGYGATLAYYDRLGYERVGLIKDFYGEGDDLVTQVLAV